MKLAIFLLVFAWFAAVFGTCAYVVFWKDASGWWFLLAFLLCWGLNVNVKVKG